MTATPNATDALSGVAAQSCAAPDTSTAGAAHGRPAPPPTPPATRRRRRWPTPSPRSPPPATTYKITKVKVARNGNLSFRIKASRSGRVRLSAKAGKVKFKSANKRLTATRRIKVTLKLSKKARTAFLKKLQGGKKVKVKLTITPTPGKKKTFTLTVRRR